MDRTADKLTPWMPMREALERAGSLEALRPHLRNGTILARHQGLYAWPRGEAHSGPGNVKPEWWADAREDPVTGRLIFSLWSDRFQITIVLGDEVLRFDKSIAVKPNDVDPDDIRQGVASRPPPDEELFAIDIELEAGPVDRLFPITTVTATRPAEAASTSVVSTPSKKPTTVSQSDLTDWYTKTYIPDRITAGDRPSREQDESAADNHFKGFYVPRDWLRALRRDHAPEAWTKRGRPADG